MRIRMPESAVEFQNDPEFLDDSISKDDRSVVGLAHLPVAWRQSVCAQHELRRINLKN